MDRIAPGVYSVPMTFEYSGRTRLIHPAVIETETGLILVDTGLPNHVESLETQLSDGGFDIEMIEQIVITHQDIDHAGGLAEVRRRSGALVVAHTDDAPYVAGDRELLKGTLGSYPSVPIDIEVVNGVGLGAVAGTVRVVATPGHTPGHISIYIPNKKLLLAADAITAEEDFDGPNESATIDMVEATESIGRLAKLDVDRTLCFHGGLIDHEPDRIRAIYEELRAAYS